MEFVIGALIVAGAVAVIQTVRVRDRKTWNREPQGSTAQRDPGAPAAKAQRIERSDSVDVSARALGIEPARIVDLRQLPSVRYRVKGSAYVASDAARREYGGQKYLLVREPDNEHDGDAVAVYGYGHKLGYVSAAKTGTVGPLLDRLPGDGFVVSGAAATAASIALRIDLPAIPALREHVRSASNGGMNT